MLLLCFLALTEHEVRKAGPNGRLIFLKGEFPKIPAKPGLDGRLWPRFCGFVFGIFQFSEKKEPRCDLGQHLLEKFSSRCWIRRGVISCAPHASFLETNESVVNSERGELVTSSDPLLVHGAHSTPGDVWRAPIRLLLQTHLAAGV